MSFSSKILSLMALVASATAQAAPVDYKKLIDLPAAHEITRGSPELLIATLNTGVNYDLPEFRGRILRSHDGSYGYDAVKNQADAMDQMEFGLGTKVASLVVGNTLGLAPASSAFPVRIFDSNGASSYEIIARGMSMALESGAKVIEFGGGPVSNLPKSLCDLFQQADARGILLVLPAGNDSEELSEYPLGCPLRNAVVVTAATEDGKLASFASYGFSAVHLAAPGVEVPALGRDGRIETMSGSSAAAAFATGVAALVWSHHPEYSAAQVRAAMIRGSKPTEGLAGKVRGNGMINALGALQADVSHIE